MRGKEFQGYSDLRLLQVMLGWWSHWYVRCTEVVHQGKAGAKNGYLHSNLKKVDISRGKI